MLSGVYVHFYMSHWVLEVHGIRRNYREGESAD